MTTQGKKTEPLLSAEVMAELERKRQETREKQEKEAPAEAPPAPQFVARYEQAEAVVIFGVYSSDPDQARLFQFPVRLQLRQLSDGEVLRKFALLRDVRQKLDVGELRAGSNIHIGEDGSMRIESPPLPPEAPSEPAAAPAQE